MASLADVRVLFQKPLMQLIAEATRVHGENFKMGELQLSSLLSIKTGGCPEDCAYCPQSARYKTGVAREALMTVTEVQVAARRAKESGASRFCMGAAWREVREGENFERVLEMVAAVKAEGLQVCCTLGLLDESQAKRLKTAGLYAYNHNLDSSREFYDKIISTRTYDDRLRTIENVRSAGLTVCTGGIIGMGESDEDRIGLLHQLQAFAPHPESVTINALIPSAGTPLANKSKVKPFEIVRVIATARLLMPKSMIRLSAGREGLAEEAQLLCLLAGANSVFIGKKLLTSPNPELHEDRRFFREAGVAVL